MSLQEPRFGPVDGHATADYRECDGTRVAMSSVDGHVALGSVYNSGRLERMRGAVGWKRFIDFSVASVSLLLLLPFLFAVGVLVRASSSGPALFRQQRYGLDGQLFEIVKFRTMDVNMGDPLGVVQTKVDDGRVTPIGRVLRRHNIDELPQLINVVRGDMSLVGPRPHVPGMKAGGRLYEDLVPYYFARTTVRPGLTGLAQVNGLRGSTVDAGAAIKRVDHDLAYISHWSLKLDIKILWQTLVSYQVRGGGI